MSKTKVMKGFQCAKALYLTIQSPDLEDPIDPDQQRRFDQGSEVGVEARKRFPGGVLVENVAWDFVGSLKRTRDLMAAQTPVIFEAAFEYKGLYARADVIVFSAETGRWSIFEVKSATKVKPEYIEDIRLQTWIMVNNGLGIEKIHILHLNSDCVYPDLTNLFVEVDVTDQVRDGYKSLPQRLNEMFLKLREPAVPPTKIGPHCESPYPCSFQTHCFNEQQIPVMSVFNLPNIREKKWDYLSDGQVRLEDVPLTELNDIQQRIVQVHRTQKRYHNHLGVKESMKDWKFPLVFLDFETINPAIPKYKGTSPYNQVPFQFSVHIWPKADAELTHHEYLDGESVDPREKMIPELLKACGKEGSIVAYFSRFEGDRIKEMAEIFPQYRAELLALCDRLVDPLPIIREHIYDSKFQGSFSLKDVGPALLGDKFSYAGMEVANGTSCQRAFEELISPKTSVEKRLKVREEMLRYCRKDTWVMVELVKWMRGSVELSSSTAQEG